MLTELLENSLVQYLAVFLILILYFFHKNIINIFNKDEGPVLSASELLADKNLQTMSKSTYAGYKYSLLYNGIRVIAVVDLGFKSRIHVFAAGDKNTSNIPARLRHKDLTKVNLEGDFPDYFKLYCTRDLEIELLTIFEPVTMAYFADFCRSHSFEIYMDMLYISQSDKVSDKGDQTSMIADMQRFLDDQSDTLKRLATNRP